MQNTVTIYPANINGYINAPTSKSSMQRACAAALLIQSQSIIYNPGKSNDDLAALHIIQQLGAVVKHHENKVLIDSSQVNFNNNTTNNYNFSCGESGLSIRMFTPIAALFNNAITITGNGSLANRPMLFFDEVLPKLSVAIKSNNGFLPLTTKGPIKPIDIEVDGSLSSQFLTGLLMAYSVAVTQNEGDENDCVIRVNELKSKPYISLTLAVMQHFNMLMPNNDDFETFTFTANHLPQKIKNTIEYTVEGDWSGAAFLVVAAAIAGKIELKGLDEKSTQADKAIMKAINDAGAIVTYDGDVLIVETPQDNLKSFAFDATDCPDLFPPLVALASYCKGTTIIKGVSRLAHKESNRGLTLQAEFKKMGIRIELDNDFMKIKPSNLPIGAKVHSHHDHRIAMACAVAALKANGNTTIDEANAIDKSYPNFYEHLKQLGVLIGH